MSRIFETYAVPGSVIQAKPEFCPHCDGREIVKRGVRKNSYRQLQVYFCKHCGRKFHRVGRIKGSQVSAPRHCPGTVFLSLGKLAPADISCGSLPNIRTSVPRRTITEWISSYFAGSPRSRTLRPAAVLKFRNAMVRERTLEHQQVYQFKVHEAKIDLVREAIPLSAQEKLKGYLFFCLGEAFPDDLFQDLGPRIDGGDQAPDSTVALRSSKSSFCRHCQSPLVQRQKPRPTTLPRWVCCSPAELETGMLRCRISHAGD